MMIQSFGELRALEELRHLLAVAQPHVGLLPIRTLAREASLTLDLAMRHGRAHAGHLRAQQLLDRLLDLHLGGVDVDAEHQRLLVLLLEERRLLADQRPSNDIRELHQANASCSRSSAVRVAITRVASITSRADTRPACRNRTPAMLRVDRGSFSSGW